MIKGRVEARRLPLTRGKRRKLRLLRLAVDVWRRIVRHRDHHPLTLNAAGSDVRLVPPDPALRETDYDAWWAARRRYLLAQAEEYMRQHGTDS